MGFGSGGGSSGKMSWPTYMHDMHHQWLNNWQDDTASRPWVDDLYPNVGEVMKNATTAVGGNPFTGAVAYSPDVDIFNAQDAVDDWNADVNSGWTAFLTSAMAGIDATIATPTEFAGMENVASDRIRRDANKGLSRFNGRMLDIGAIQSSTYMMALVMQEQEVRDRVFEFITGQEDSIRQARFVLLQSLGGTRLDSLRALAAQQGQVSQFTTVAKSEEQQINQQWENAEATWDLDLFQYGSNVLAGISGAQGQAKGQSQTALQKSLSSVALGGAAALALGAAGTGSAYAVPAIAALGGPVGLGIGALVAGISFFA